MKQTLKIAVAGVGVGVVSLAGVGLASAHTPGGGNGEGQDEIQNRVAEILEIDVTDLGDALQQAREEHRTAEMDARLDQAVVDGTITQEEADEIRDWLDARPEVFEELKGAKGHGGSEGNGLEVRLAELVEDGTITQAEADAPLEWSADRPEAMSEIRPDRGEREGRRGRGHDRGQGRRFELRVAPGADGEIGRFGGFLFQLPPGFEAPDTTPPVDESAL
jgi:hypothetical protein